MHKFLLTVLLLVNVGLAFPQDSLLLQLQTAHKSREYISVDLQPLFRTSTEITKTTAKEVLTRLNTPGFAFGADYHRVSQSGFTFVSGIHFRMIPVAYKFNVDYKDFSAGGPGDHNFGRTNVNLVNGHLYFPIQAGYTAQTKIGNWQPSVMAGINLSHPGDYSLISSSSYVDSSNVSRQIQDLFIDYPEHTVWLTYTVNVRASKTMRGGNQIYIGINTNFSGVTYNRGHYNLYPTSGKQSGTFSDTGSYVALQFGFSLVRRYKEPDKFDR